MKFIRQIISVLGFFFLATFMFAQDTGADIKEKASKLFDNEQYVEATSLYLRLISLNPEDFDYNYRYGTCLLFNSDQKKIDALRYLSYATKGPSIDPRAYYFRAKALHWNYQFKDAKKMYQKYKSKKSSKDTQFDVDREMEMCDNGKRLLSTFTDIIVSEKKQIAEEKFFRLYHDMESIGGKILVTERFQSKMDKKLGHVPIIHFPNNATSVFYSSYGEKGETGLDIYIRKKLPDGSWGEPFMLPGEVNTRYDDNFPYLHPNGQYLYFSSKGHNSMGGYDIFMARFDESINGFIRTENVDFAICSPDDDLFYVVDSTFQNAYFASARQSEDGKVHVYRVKVARIPIKEIIIMGDFLSEINLQNKEMLVTVIAGATGNEVGIMKSNGVGKYSFVFPQGGKYTYRIKIAGMDEVTEIDLVLPFLDEFRPLKQKVIHAQVDGGEVVKIINLFDERVEGGSELIGPILRKKAELPINIDQIDPLVLATIDMERRRDEILAELGFNGMATREVQNKLNELARDERDKDENVTKMSDGIDQNIINASLDLKTLASVQQELIKRAAQSSDPLEKYEYLKEAKKTGGEITGLIDQIASLNELKETIRIKFGDNGEDGVITVLANTFKTLIDDGKEEEAWNQLALRKSEIFKVRNSSPKALIADMVDESVELRKEGARLRNRNTDNSTQIRSLEADTALLKGQLPGAKKRRQKEIEAEIASKEIELKAYREDEKFNKQDIAALERKADGLDENVDVLQESITGNLVASVSIEEVEAAIRAANEFKNDNPETQISNDIAALENDFPEIVELNPTIISTTTSVKEVMESGHAEAVTEILSNDEQSEAEKLERLIANNGSTISAATTEIQAIQSRLESDPENMDLLEEQMELVQYRTGLEEETNGWIAEVEVLNNQIPPVAVITSSEIIDGIKPGHEQQMIAIIANDQLKPIEQLTQLQNAEQELLTNTQTAIDEVNLQLENNPGDPDLVDRKNALNEIASITSNMIDERAQEINALTNVSSIIDVEEIKTNILSDVGATHETDKEEIRQSGKTGWQISIGLWELEQELLNRLETEQIAATKIANDNPKDQEAQARIKAISQLVEEQNETISGQRDLTLQEVLNGDRYQEVIGGVDRKYGVEIGDLLQESPRNNDAIAEREAELQEKIKKEIEKKKRTMDRSYSIDVDLEWMILEYELTQSEKREAEANTGSEVIASQPDKQEYIEEIRNNLLSGQGEEVEKTYTAREELETQDQLLQNYENELMTELSVLEVSQLENATKENELKLDWVKDELGNVRRKRGTISISLDEFETEVIATTVGANESKAESIAASQINQDNLTTQLIKSGDPDNEVTVAIINSNQTESQAIDQLLQDAAKAKSVDEQEYLLNQAETRQAALVSTLEEVIRGNEVKEIERREGITINNQGDLEQRKRRYRIQIGDLDTQIIQVEEEISEAKRRDLPELDAKRDGLIAQRAIVAGQLNDVNTQLSNIPVARSLPTISSSGLNQSVSFNEERVIAASDGYAVYRVEGVKVLELENQVRSIEDELKIERVELLGVINGSNPKLSDSDRQDEIELRTNRIKQMEGDLERINADLKVQSAIANQLLPPNQEESMKMKNLLARGVQPIKMATVALSVIQMPATTGLAINEATPSIYSEKNPIPVGVESPSGLTYRVQVGAFARPIPQDLFKEFNPVSGEKIGNTGITRYMAGFFNSSVSVVEARQQIRELGYRDAFVVAYCDGERISFGEARRREANGSCVPKGVNELMLEVAENTANHMGIPMTNEVKEVPEHTYNQAPGAVPADPIELKKGLFFTVQIGAYNRPVTDKRLKELPEILTVRLPNGQIRYSSGMFDSASDCKSRKIKAYESGITDAFIVAYYQGVRIKISEANNLLSVNGPSILQSSIEAEEPVLIVETPPDVIRTDTVNTTVVEAPVEASWNEELKVQVVTKRTFETFPRDILNRYNTEGNFYYDALDGKVKSIIYDHPDMLPRLYKFEDDIDTLYLSAEAIAFEESKQSIQITIFGEKVPGDLVDMLLRIPYRKEFTKTRDGLSLLIDGIEPNGLAAVLNQVKMIGLEPVILEATNENDN